MPNDELAMQLHDAFFADEGSGLMGIDLWRSMAARMQPELSAAAVLAATIADVAKSDGTYAVELAGVRIERCDERGKTATTIDLEQTRLDLAYCCKERDGYIADLHDAHAHIEELRAEAAAANKRVEQRDIVLLGTRQRAVTAEAELDALREVQTKQFEDLMEIGARFGREKDDLIKRLEDVDTVLVRLKQIDAEQLPEHWLWDRVMTCDVPRLTELAALFGREAP